MEPEKRLYRILIIDDHHIIRTGIKLILGERMKVQTEEASNSSTAIEKVKAWYFDLVVLDINMPDNNGFQLLTKLLILQPELRILIFSMNPEEHFAKRFIKMGAKGYLNKEASDDEFIKAVNIILAGKKYLSFAVTQSLINDTTNEKSDKPFDLLSEREFEVAISLVKGKTLSEIADEMNLHSSTVGTYKTRILEKLNIQNVIELNQLALLYDIKISR